MFSMRKTSRCGAHDSTSNVSRCSKALEGERLMALDCVCRVYSYYHLPHACMMFLVSKAPDFCGLYRVLQSRRGFCLPPLRRLDKRTLNARAFCVILGCSPLLARAGIHKYSSGSVLPMYVLLCCTSVDSFEVASSGRPVP